jgi:hypothetical protein
MQAAREWLQSLLHEAGFLGTTNDAAPSLPAAMQLCSRPGSEISGCRQVPAQLTGSCDAELGSKAAMLAVPSCQDVTVETNGTFSSASTALAGTMHFQRNGWRQLR